MRNIYRLIGIVIFVIILLKIDFEKLATYFSKINLTDYFFINLLLLPTLLLKSYRWRYVLKLQGINYPAIPSLMSYLSGLCAGVVTPGRIGEAIKAFYLKEEKAVPLSEGLASVFIDRLFDLSVLIILSILSLCSFYKIKELGCGISLLSILLLITATLLFFKNTIIKKAVTIISVIFLGSDSIKLIEGKAREFMGSIRKVLVDKRAWVLFCLTILAYFFYFLQCYLLARLAHIDISYFNVLCFVSISGLLSSLPITVLGLGTREATFIFLFSLVGLKSEAALAYSFLLFFSFYVLMYFLACLGWIFKSRVKAKR